MAAPTDSIEISALTAGAALDGTEIVPLVQGGATVRSTLSAALTYFNANASLDAARITSGTLAVARGGTNIGSYTIGDLLYASGATTLAKLAGVATGNALISGGVATAPAWGKIDLTTHITGILPSANGGTGVNNAGTLTNATNTTITGGGTLALAGFTLTIPATGTAALLATANVFTAAQTAQRDSIGTTPTDGLILTNATAAAAGAQQYSPRLRLTGQGWKTNATAASQTVDFALYTVPVQAAANPTALLNIDSQINGGGYTNVANIDSVGRGLFAVTTGGTAANVAVGIAASRGIYSSAGNTLNISAGGAVANFATSVGFQVGSGHKIGFSSASDPGSGSNLDTAFARNAAAVVEVNNGTAGQWGALKAGVRDSGTTTVVNGLTLGHQSSGTPADGLGIGILLNINSSTTADQNAAQLTAEWATASHGSRKARVKLNVYDTAAREALRAEADGSNPMIGFLGSAAQLQQASGANLTNNVTSGGTDNQIDDFAGAVYATDAATIRNDIYQLARKLKQVNDALRLYGLLT